jgi:VIT1/CCC1 family predicted Fe2+/Mn2+ transporter
VIPQQGRYPISYLNRFLDPAESLAEILFGLIMVLTCTLGASAIAGIDRDSLRSLFYAALGCNLAWGIIDAALYVMGAIFVRTQNAQIMQAVRSATGDAAALAIVRRALEPRFETFGRNEDREQLYRSLRGMVLHTDAPRGLLRREDLGSAIAVFVLVAATALPPAVPFLLIADPVVALRVSNAVLVALLFVVGFYWARSIGGSAWRTGLIMMLSGVLMVAIAIAFGG